MKKLLLTVLTTTLISLLVACGEQSKAAEDVIKTYTVTLSAASEVPAVAVASDATGTVTVTLNETKKEVSVSGSYSGLTGPAVAAHIHGSADRSGNGPVVLDLVVTADAKSAQLQTTAGHGGHDEDKDGANSGKLSLEATSLTDAQIADMKKGMHYINVHTAANAPGEIRGQIDENVVTAYVFALSAANEVPTVATASKGTGKVTVLLNETTKEVSVSGGYSNLTGPALAAHIHGPADKTGNGPVVLDLVVTASAIAATELQTAAGHGGHDDHDEDKDGGNSGTLSLVATSVTDAQIADMKKGMHYINVHTAANPPGEIRGQIE